MAVSINAADRHLDTEKIRKSLDDLIAHVNRRRESAERASTWLRDLITKDTSQSSYIRQALKSVQLDVNEYLDSRSRLESILDNLSVASPRTSPSRKVSKRLTSERADQIRMLASEILSRALDNSLSLNQLVQSLKAKGVQPHELGKVYHLLYYAGAGSEPKEYFDLDKGLVKLRKPYANRKSPNLSRQ